MPLGWEAKALVASLVSAGMCTYTDIVTNKVTIKDLFQMLHLVDWNNYKQVYAHNAQKAP